ncbi:phage baseplate assembly protein V [Massilia sp. YIM B02763]|uniref:phage baseplate assembly protein V n=1 Tax=Massilia sp. YIM B02763 TaxID=3050130 RepID=UPI0025B64A9F|nr:phage baseplate assembly protein V [Massilia sp. YIM B02763]MDN4056338.1 phage baseplate assembly protein V [Massilia sp. YIM B02763]
MNTNDLLRLILNLVRKGRIMAVNHQGPTPTCRVQSGELQTNWIPWLAGAAGETRDWNPPTVGEPVLLLCPSGDPANAVALRGLYAEDIPAPDDNPATHTRAYPDGAVIKYDHATHALTASLPDGGTVYLVAPGSVEIHTTTATIVASELVKVDAPRTELSGDLQVDGAIAAGKDIKTPADVKAGAVSLIGHHHMEQGDGKPVGAPY